MRTRLMVLVAIVLAVAGLNLGNGSAKETQASNAKFETRCGWFVNPTPANIWLLDKDGEWLIGVQGSFQTPGDWPWPKFKRGQWVKTNVNYGYGCACLRLRVNREESEVLEIQSATARPLSACQKDPALKKWKKQLE